MKSPAKICLSAAAIVCVSCTMEFYPTTPTMYPASAASSHKLSGDLKTGAFIYAFSAYGEANDGGPERQVYLKPTESRSRALVRYSKVEGDLTNSCQQTFNTYYKVRYYVFPFIPVTRYYYRDTPIQTVIARTPTSITVTGSNVLATRSVNFIASITDAFGCPVNVVPNWTSSNNAIASVGATSGRVTGVSPGTATITATFGSISASYDVTVGLAPTISLLSLTPASPLTLEKEEAITISITATWSDGIVESIPNTTAVLTSSNSAKVSISSSGRITAAQGPATETITCNYAGRSATILVNVLAPFTSMRPQPLTIMLSSASPSATFKTFGVRSDGSETELTLRQYPSR